MTMAASVELRVPLLDHHVLEFAASLPTRHKALGWSMKRVLKRVLEPTVPATILNRKKAGFPVPYDRWMRNELRDYIRDTVLAAKSFSSQYLCKGAVTRLLDAQIDRQVTQRRSSAFSCLSCGTDSLSMHRSTALIPDLGRRRIVSRPMPGRGVRARRLGSASVNFVGALVLVFASVLMLTLPRRLAMLPTAGRDVHDPRARVGNRSGPLHDPEAARRCGILAGTRPRRAFAGRFARSRQTAVDLGGHPDRNRRFPHLRCLVYRLGLVWGEFGCYFLSASSCRTWRTSAVD